MNQRTINIDAASVKVMLERGLNIVVNVTDAAMNLIIIVIGLIIALARLITDILLL